MSRENWTNLNGIWKYTIIEKGSTEPENFQGDILVPYAIESALSGVGQTVSKDQELWYHRSFEVDRGMRKGNLLLHFGAVDWEAEVFINGKSVGMHQGGYDPFSFEISEALVSGRKQQLSIRVWDPTDEGPQPRGKQINKPHGIWYTPVTGIWQTVWLEAVPDQYISHIKNTADLDNKQISVETQVNDPQPGQMITVRLFTNGELLDEKEVPAGESTIFSIDNPNIWGPDNPFLYDIEARLMDGRKQLDAVKSYTAMRKISMKPDAYGNQRLLLNDKFLFQYGPLDQGWWPDGLYTAPTEEALVYDIDKTKEMGFNMIRKHVKVEPARWYYHCDKIGMLVWQDMPSGDMGNRWEARPGVVGKGTERKRSPESMAIFKKNGKPLWMPITIFLLLLFGCLSMKLGANSIQRKL